MEDIGRRYQYESQTAGLTRAAKEVFGYAVHQVNLQWEEALVFLKDSSDVARKYFFGTNRCVLFICSSTTEERQIPLLQPQKIIASVFILGIKKIYKKGLEPRTVANIEHFPINFHVLKLFSDD